MYLDCCRWEYVKIQSRDDSLWESFPQALQTKEGAGRYISAFRAPFQELPSLSPLQIYTLRVCSLLVIPPPIGRVAPQGGFPTDLMEINLSGWAALVQDVVAGLQALPPRLSQDLGPQIIALLQLLEMTTGVGFVTIVVIQDLTVGVQESLSQLPPHRGVSIWSRLLGMG